MIYQLPTINDVWSCGFTPIVGESLDLLAICSNSDIFHSLSSIKFVQVFRITSSEGALDVAMFVR